MSDRSLTKAISQSNFLRVMSYYKLSDEEVAICKQLYRDDPEGWRVAYASIASLLPARPYDDGVPKSGMGSWVHPTPGTVGQQAENKVKRA